MPIYKIYINLGYLNYMAHLKLKNAHLNFNYDAHLILKYYVANANLNLNKTAARENNPPILPRDSCSDIGRGVAVTLRI